MQENQDLHVIILLFSFQLKMRIILFQMISSGCIDKSELPDFDDETGLLPKDEDGGEADIEIELVEDEPPFLQGHGRALHDLSPVRYVTSKAFLLDMNF